MPFAAAPVALPAQERGTPGDSNWVVSLVTVGPGKVFASSWGHAAIMMARPGSTESLMFEYGVTPTGRAATTAALRGRLRLRSVTRPTHLAMATWRKDGRWVAIQRLRMSGPERAALLDYFATAQQRAPPTVAYEPRTTNCATQLRDALDHATHGALTRVGGSPRAGSMRQLLFTHLASPATVLIADALINQIGDRPATQWDAAIFPDELARLVDMAGLATGPPELNGEVTSVGDNPANQYAATVAISVAMLIALWLLGRSGRQGHRAMQAASGLLISAIGLVMGGLGTAIVFLELVTPYDFVQHNLNLLFVNPLWLALVPIGAGLAARASWATRWLRRIVGVLACGVVLRLCAPLAGVTAQDDWHILLVAISAIVGTYLGFARLPGIATSRVLHARTILQLPDSPSNERAN